MILQPTMILMRIEMFITCNELVEGTSDDFLELRSFLQSASIAHSSTKCVNIFEKDKNSSNVHKSQQSITEGIH